MRAPTLPAPAAVGQIATSLLALRSAPAPEPGIELDLPAVAHARPAAEIKTRSPIALSMDPGTETSPAQSPRPAFADLDLDLPAPRAAAPAAGFGDLDLPAPKAPPIAPPFVPAVPSPVGVERVVGGALGDLPELDGVGFDELRSPTSRADTFGTDTFGELDSPSLFPPPAPAERVPSVIPSLPPEPDLPIPRDALDLPAPKERISAAPARNDFGELDLPALRPPRTPSPRATEGQGGVPADLPLPSLDLDLPTPDAPSAIGRAPAAGAGSAAFGEVDLGGGAEDMEFSDLPQSSEVDLPSSGIGTAIPVVSQRPVPPIATRAKEETAGKKPKNHRAVLAFGAVLFVLLCAGAALKLTPYGFFGMYALEQFLPGAGDPSAVTAAIRSAERRAASDTYTDVRHALEELGRARKDAGLHRGLLTRSIVHEALYQARFGEDAASSARIGGMLARLAERGNDAPGVTLALAADALRRGDTETAIASAEQAKASASEDPYPSLLLGEAHLRSGSAQAARDAFAAALAQGGAARAQWGIARALGALGRPTEEVLASIDATLALSPRHAGARIAKAERWAGTAHETEALALLTELTSSAELRPAPAEHTAVWVELGKIHERAGRTRQAHTAYAAALGRDSLRVDALLGDGRVLLAQRRYAEALARFEAALSAAGSNPGALGQRAPAVEAKLRGAEALVGLDRAAEARATLTQLAQAEPADADVLLALGRVEQALGDTSAAEQRFREAIQRAPTRIDPYLALAELFFGLDRGGPAAEVLDKALHEVPESAQKYTALGTLRLRRNDARAAVESFRRALVLDPTHDEAEFGLGVASRRAGDLEGAARSFDAVAARSPEFPGLSLERGMLYEVQGRAELAVAAYERALAEHPDDADLLLRLGAAQVAAEQLDAAEATLEKVRTERPNSAEAEHFIGRVAFARGEVAAATTHFERAVQLGADRAEFHLYAGRAALERGDLSRALSAVDAAIERDASLGDAWWVRGEVRLRAGQVRDALADLARARELKPARYAALAAMGECFDQLGDRRSAIAAYEQATSLEPENGRWLARLGRLYLDGDNARAAAAVLERATRVGEEQTSRPPWLAEAHRLYGDALRLNGAEAQAIPQYRRYLELAPPGALDRDDVERTLARMQ